MFCIYVNVRIRTRFLFLFMTFGILVVLVFLRPLCAPEGKSTDYNRRHLDCRFIK